MIQARRHVINARVSSRRSRLAVRVSKQDDGPVFINNDRPQQRYYYFASCASSSSSCVSWFGRRRRSRSSSWSSSSTQRSSLIMFSTYTSRYSTSPVTSQALPDAAALNNLLEYSDDSNNSNNIDEEEKERFVLSSLSHLMGPEFHHSIHYHHHPSFLSSSSPTFIVSNQMGEVSMIDETASALEEDWGTSTEEQRLEELLVDDTDHRSTSWLSSLREEEEREQEQVFDDPWERSYIDRPPVAHPKQRQQQQQQHDQHMRHAPSIVDLLRNFDPQNPPNLEQYADRQSALEHLEWWLECEAQQEAVLRYQKVIDAARDRHDFSSMGIVQKLIVRWFKPLRAAIEERQKEYLNKTETSITSIKKFGPIICALPADKLAAITAHAAITAAVVGSDRSNMNLHDPSHGGVAFTAMARRIGQAVEDEVLIHRLLRKRFMDKQKKRPLTLVETNIAEFLVEKNDKAEESASKSGIEFRNGLSGPGLGPLNWTYASSHLKMLLNEVSYQQLAAKKQRNLAYAVRKARAALESDEEWSECAKIQLGAALFQLLSETATIQDEGKDECAFTLEKHWMKKDKLQGFVHLNDRFHKMLVLDKMESLAAVTTLHKPMIVPPTPWTTCGTTGGYRVLHVDLMRFRGSKTQEEALLASESITVVDGLNALARVRWKINKAVLKVAQECWENNVALGTDIPSRTDLDVPEVPIAPTYSVSEKGSEDFENKIRELNDYRERLHKYNRMRQKNMVRSSLRRCFVLHKSGEQDLRSLRYSALLKLNQAEKFKNFDAIYFPYNVDFRGRAYPIPPHLSNIGSDICRGMLMFADAKPLGDRGLYWLKVHLANFAGNDKITFDERAKFVDDHLDHVRAAALDPLGVDRWWMTLDDPFQGLATCMEIVKAIDSGNPAAYECSLPVHMDGSCNGLQHYAALGRDRHGGKAVNLCATDKPQDVYIGVMHEVKRRVAAEAARTLDFDVTRVEDLSKQQKKEISQNRAAKLVDGLIDRGVVKRTVMTSVYGVTYIGARTQIQEKIESKLEEEGHDVDEMQNEIFQACGYLASVTMEVIGDLFTGAKGTMNWLTTCARLISQHGYPVAWVSPIGLPAIQPYRQKKMATLVTLLQTLSIVHEGDNLPIHRTRQVSAFPPNYIHSLDSSHMLLTALEMDRRGLTFSAVHDSFWTHACDIDEMNSALREVFVDLYRQPLLEELKETWELRYPDLELPDLPERGDLDLEEVRRAPYFFQ